MGVTERILRRRVAVVVAIVVLGVHNTAGASPQGPTQEDSSDGEGAARGAVELNVDVSSADAADVVAAAGDIAANVSENLRRYDDAQAAIDAAVQELATADSAIVDTELRIEELVLQSDQVVVEAFVSPPSIEVIDTLTMDNATEAAIKQGVLDIQADTDAHVLTQLQEQREQLEGQREDQRRAREDADEARRAAEAALDDLDGAMDQQTQFVIAVQRRLDSESDAAERLAQSDPALAAQLEATRGELRQALEAVAAQRAAEEAARRIQEERERQVRANGFLCPVNPPSATDFIDSWGYARSGGRRHQGTDMMADYGVETVAPVSGRLVHKSSGLGGLTWYVYGDNGHTYYGAHLQSYANEGAGRVEAGTVIGYVGDSGNAAGTPHLHFEYKPGGGSSVNPYPYLVNACPGSAR